MCAMFFFFQAEDGIRDGHVTGVQTCALPISIWLSIAVRSAIMPPRSALRLGPDRWYEGGLVGTYQPPPRSDDRKTTQTNQRTDRRWPQITMPPARMTTSRVTRSEEHTSELPSRGTL